MITQLASIVAQAQVRSLSLVGLAKNVGKTTTTNALLETLLSERLYHAEELALTSFGLDGEVTDALTGLPKPRYVPRSGLLVATTAELIQRAEHEGAQVERLISLPGRTALGPVLLARVLHPGRIIIAGPTLLRDLRSTLIQCHHYGARLSIIDGAINRLGAAAPTVTDACIVCTGASVALTPELVARRTADVLTRLLVPQSRRKDAYKQQLPSARLLMVVSDHKESISDQFTGFIEPAAEAQWIIRRMSCYSQAVFLLRGALTEELSRRLLRQLAQHSPQYEAELVVADGTKIFCHSAVLQRLAARGLHMRVAHPIRILALTINPYTPEYLCTPQQMLDTLLSVFSEEYPPVLDVMSGVMSSF